MAGVPNCLTDQAAFASYALQMRLSFFFISSIFLHFFFLFFWLIYAAFDLDAYLCVLPQTTWLRVCAHRTIFVAIARLFCPSDLAATAGGERTVL